MLKAVKRDEAEAFNLPGRDWFLYIGPESSEAKNMTVGFATFPEGSAPPGHVHPIQEEIIYITSGHGELVTPEGTAKLDPGTVVYIEANTQYGFEVWDEGVRFLNIRQGLARYAEAGEQSMDPYETGAAKG